MSRTSDITRNLDYRTSEANTTWGADIFVSIHINAGGGTGFESYRYPTSDAATVCLHNNMHSKVTAGMRSVASATDRGQKTANFMCCVSPRCRPCSPRTSLLTRHRREPA